MSRWLGQSDFSPQDAGGAGMSEGSVESAWLARRTPVASSGHRSPGKGVMSHMV